MLSNRSVPASTVIPVLPYPEIGEAVRWLCDTFGFRLRLRIGDHRAQLDVPPDGNVVVGAHTRVRNSAEIMIRVADVHAHHARVAASGARIISPPTDYPYGERQYTVLDFAGHYWTFSESISDIDPAEWGGIFYGQSA